MTAASGVVHEERHATEFTRHGGTLEMIQLWVNLPAREKMSTPRYQEILSASIPTVTLRNGTGSARVIAGALGSTKGPARTVTPMNVWDIRLNRGGSAAFDLPQLTNTLVLLLRGSAAIGETLINEHECAVLGRDGEAVRIKAKVAATILLLNGQPIDEPVVAHGPFVMNSTVEIKQAMADYQSGRMGRLEPLAR